MSKQKKKVFRWGFSYRKELAWLEAMAAKGWFLKNITYGLVFTFEKGEPKRMLYEIDRFNLPKNPTLEEIRHKEIFMDVAQELGWQEVAHDESLTYYFCKEYAEGDINELYNDAESRQMRVQKFEDLFHKKAKELVFWGLVIVLFAVFFRFVENAAPFWFDIFSIIYVILANSMALFCWKMAEMCRAEFTINRSEWDRLRDKSKYKCVRRFLFNVKKLNRFLEQQGEQGWILTKITSTKFYFEKREETKQIYTMDSKWLTNRRCKEKRQQGFKDSKDWIGMNNDWQVQSLKDAEECGWTFVCALENRAVIYRGDSAAVQPLNDEKYTKGMRGVSLIGDYGLTLMIAGFIGGCIGFVCAMIGL